MLSSINCNKKTRKVERCVKTYMYIVNFVVFVR